MKQNTAEWLEMRKSMIGASDVPILMFHSIYATPYQLWLQKMGLLEQEINAGMQFGHDKEDEIRQQVSLDLLCPLEPEVIKHPNGFMIASLDGYNEEFGLMHEFKCNNAEKHEIAKSGKPPEEHYDQVQAQLLCVNAYRLKKGLTIINEAGYSSFHKNDLVTIFVKQNPEYQATIEEEAKKFKAFLDTKTPPSLCARDYINQDNNEKFKELVPEFKALSDEIKSKKARYEEIKKELINECSGHNAFGQGLQLTRSVVAGAIDYSSIPELEGIDLEKYRKPSFEKWTPTFKK